MSHCVKIVVLMSQKQAKERKKKEREMKAVVNMMRMIFGMVSRKSGCSVRIRNVKYGCQ